MAKCGTNDHLQVIKRLIEKCVECNKALIIVFVDYEMLFDTMSYLHLCIDQRYSALLKHMYENVPAKISGHVESNSFDISRVVDQINTISLKFSSVIEYMCKNICI